MLTISTISFKKHQDTEYSNFMQKRYINAKICFEVIESPPLDGKSGKSYPFMKIHLIQYSKMINPVRIMSSPLRHLCKKNSNDHFPDNNEDMSNVLRSISSKYQVFRNEDSSIILDINEENLNTSLPLNSNEEENDEFGSLNLERGTNGVYEIEDLVDVLKSENAKNILIASVPKQYKYVDYICIVTGRSNRHMMAIAQFVRRVYKKKRKAHDILPKIEGENSSDWIALDLGNIALHIFSSEARTRYDLDLLWSVGEEYDDECNKPDDPIVKMLEQHSLYLRDLEPNETDTK